MAFDYHASHEQFKPRVNWSEVNRRSQVSSQQLSLVSKLL